MKEIKNVKNDNHRQLIIFEGCKQNGLHRGVLTNSQIFVLFDIAPVYQAAGRYAPYGDGIQHGKVLLVGHYLLAGSANWTVASRCNVEYGLLVALSSEGVEQFRKTFQKSYDRSVDFTLEVQAGAGHRCVKPRARSMSPYHSPSPHGTKYLRQGYAQFGG